MIYFFRIIINVANQSLEETRCEGISKKEIKFCFNLAQNCIEGILMNHVLLKTGFCGKEQNLVQNVPAQFVSKSVKLGAFDVAVSVSVVVDVNGRYEVLTNHVCESVDAPNCCQVLTVESKLEPHIWLPRKTVEERRESPQIGGFFPKF